MGERGRKIWLAMWPGIKLGWIPIALVLLAHLPGRAVYATNAAIHGRPAWQFFCAGILADLGYVGPPVFVAFVLPLAIGALVARWRPSALVVSSIATTALAVIFLVPAWLFSVGAIESKIARGLYPTYLETKVNLTSSSFVTGSLPTLMLDRYWKTSALVIVVSAVLLYFHARRARRDLHSAPRIAGFALVGLMLLGCGGRLVRHSREVFPRTGGSDETHSPIETVALGGYGFADHTPLADGMRQLFSEREYSEADKRSGLRGLGYPPSSYDRLVAFEHDEPCTSPHPLSRPLDREPGASGSGAKLLDELEELSSALFEKRDEPIVVWQITMESFRADDMHALQPLAPPELTPTMDRLYAERERTVAFRHAFQAGMRTAHNLSALQCGFGAMPFNIAIARDLGHFPVRCLPDVLSDAGFDTHATYASDLAYDNMHEFFRYHGVDATQASDMPPGLPSGSWHGVSDRALFDQAISHAEAVAAKQANAANGGRSQYEYVLTLSGHTPFTRPTDMPPEVLARTTAACAKSPSAREDDCKRLGVIAYGDYALGELLDRIERSKLGRRSVVIISADHSTSEMFVWPGSSVDRGLGLVPFLVYVPKALAESSSRPEAVGEIVGRLHDRAANEVVSLADSPTMMTSLLKSTREMRSIPAAWRYHTFGAQITSPDFRFDGNPAARIWGTNAGAMPFVVDAEGTATQYEPMSRGFSAASQLDTMNPHLRGPSAFLASFTKGYLRRCEQQAKLRMSSP